jgi:1,4-alpha-glucan branching enzyme
MEEAGFMVIVNRNNVEFRFLRPAAREVFLVGEFNEWSKDDMPMRKCGKGYWTAKLRLPYGDFRFRYWADGQWYTDFAAFGVEPGPYGPVGLVHVPEPEAVASPAPGCEPISCE